MQLLLAQREKLLAALVFQLGGHDAGYLQGLCAGALAVAEHVELADGQRRDEVVGFPEQLIRLAPHAYDDIHADESIGDVVPHLFYLVGKELGVVASVHEAEHFVAAALQGDVEVRHEGAAFGTEAEDFLREQIRLDAADAVALDAFHAVEGTQQVDEALARRLAEVADVDSGQHDFLSSLPGCFFCLAYERGDASVAAAAPGVGYGAVGAEVVAAVLNLEEEARPLSAGAGGEECAGSLRCDLCVSGGRAECLCYETYDAGFLLGAHHEVHALKGRQLFGT